MSFENQLQNPIFSICMSIEFNRTLIDIFKNAMGGSIGGPEVAQTVLTERQHAVLELIKRNPRMAYRQMADELGINDSAVKKHLDKLKEAGVIERVGGTRGYWKVKE